MLFAELAKLAELQTLFKRLFVFTTVIIDLLALGALHFDKIVLGHKVVIMAKSYQRDFIPSMLEPVAGLEPATYGLQNRCSTAELHRRG